MTCCDRMASLKRRSKDKRTAVSSVVFSFVGLNLPAVDLVIYAAPRALVHRLIQVTSEEDAEVRGFYHLLLCDSLRSKMWLI